MPVAEAASYHGYDVLDYTAIERDYGTAEDLLAFVTAAHERGIAVIVDLVINHTSRGHPWFVDALAGGEHEDWYLWADVDPGWPGAAGPNPWHRADNGRYYYSAFWEGMPDLNLRNPAVTDEIEAIAAAWLHGYGVDGFRLDAAKHLIEDGPDAQVNTPETHAWLAGFREAAHAVRPDALVLGEVWEPRGTTTGYVTDGSLDLVFDFGIGTTIASSVQLGDSNSLVVTEAEIADRYPLGSVATFLTNHDQPRIMTTLRGDVAAAKLAAGALLTGPGVPFVYYGEELGMVGTKPDEQIRTPLPWTAEAPGQGFTAGEPWEPFASGAETANVATEAADPASLLSTYRSLIRLRSVHPVLAGGALTRVTASAAGVTAVVRHDDAEALLVLHNLNREPSRDVSLTLDVGPLCGSPSAALLYSSDDAAGPAPAAPMITSAGGLGGYVPLPELPAGSTVVIDLSP
jgi:glycosidase